jgi:hypothetical protein
MKKRPPDKFLNEYNRQLGSISRILKNHKQKQFIGYVLNLLEGATSVERRARELQRDFNLTFRLIDEIKDANAELYRNLPDETFNRLTDSFADLNYLISQRLHAVQLALYDNREIPYTKLRAIPLRKTTTRGKKRVKARTGARHDR